MRRLRPGTVVIREVRYYQKNVGLLVPPTPFRRLVRESGAKVGFGGVRFRKDAFSAVEKVAEEHIVHLFEEAMLRARYAKRVTVTPKDVAMARRIRGGKLWVWWLEALCKRLNFDLLSLLRVPTTPILSFLITIMIPTGALKMVMPHTGATFIATGVVTKIASSKNMTSDVR